MNGNDESQFIGSISNKDFAPVVKKHKNVAATEKAENQKEVAIALLPAVDLFKELIAKEKEAEDSLSVHMRKYGESKPNGDELYQEFRASQRYIEKLDRFEKLLDAAARIENNDS
jgi:hypothetical protein